MYEGRYLHSDDSVYSNINIEDISDLTKWDCRTVPSAISYHPFKSNTSSKASLFQISSVAVLLFSVYQIESYPDHTILTLPSLLYRCYLSSCATVQLQQPSIPLVFIGLKSSLRFTLFHLISTTQAPTLRNHDQGARAATDNKHITNHLLKQRF